VPRRSAIRFAGGLLALSALACGPLSAQVGQTTDPKVQRQSLYVPVRDGTRLAVNIYRSASAASARQPTIFAFTPYRARYFKDGKIEEAFNQKIFGFRDLVQAGYAVVIADVRGKGASFGARRGFLDRTEALDGRDLVQWVARQPWSDGKVGLTGCSYDPRQRNLAELKTDPAPEFKVATGGTNGSRVDLPFVGPPRFQPIRSGGV
jgi:predicted acyl esterase